MVVAVASPRNQFSVGHQRFRPFEMLASLAGWPQRTLDASIAGLVGAFQNMRVAIDDLQVRQTPIMEQVRPAQTPILVPDAIKRHAMIDFRVLPEAAARLPAAACLKSSQQRRLFAWRIPELPSDDAGAMPGGALVRAFAPQVDMPAEVIDTLSAHAAEAGAACKGLFSIGRGRDTKCRGHSALRLAELPRPSVRLAASRRQRTRETIRAQRMSAPVGVDGKPRRRRNEWPGERPAEHAGWENSGQCLPSDARARGD